MSNLIFAESAMDCIAAIFVREADVRCGSVADKRKIKMAAGVTSVGSTPTWTVSVAWIAYPS